MSLGPWQIFLVLLIILVLFGAGRLPQVMGDLGKGLRNLRDEIGKKGSGGVSDGVQSKVDAESDAADGK